MTSYVFVGYYLIFAWTSINFFSVVTAAYYHTGALRATTDISHVCRTHACVSMNSDIIQVIILSHNESPITMYIVSNMSNTDEYMFEHINCTCTNH